MAGINAEIEILKRETEKTEQTVSSLYRELGETACQYHRVIAYEPSNAVFEKLCAAAERRDETDARIKTLRNAVTALDANDRQIEETRMSLKDLDSRFHTLLAALGAVSAELEEAGKLPAKFSECMVPVHEYKEKTELLEKKAGAYGKSPAGSFYRWRLRGQQRLLDGVFYEAGKKIYELGGYKRLPGNRVQGIAAEIDSINARKKNFSFAISQRESAISRAEDSLKNLGALGGETRTLRELETQRKVVQEELDGLFESYGSIISRGMDNWLDQQAPEELVSVCARLKTELTRLAEQHLNMEYLLAQRDIEEHLEQADMYATQLGHLNSQKTAIEKQIKELQARIDAEHEVVSNLQGKQREISREALDRRCGASGGDQGYQ